MANTNEVQRVRIYVSMADRWEGEPLYLAVLDALKRSGATGATALQGLAGFGPGQRMRPGPLVGVTGNQPVVIEWVDRTERVHRLLPRLDAMLGDALITVEPVPVYRALLRARGPFRADRGVGEIVSPHPPTLRPDDPLSAALHLFTTTALGTLPVVDAEQRLVGVLTEQDLAWRANLRIGPRLLTLLTEAERDALLSPLIGRTVASVMSVEPKSVHADTVISQALVSLIESGYSQLPLTDPHGQFVGMLGADDVLRAALAQTDTAADEGIQDAEPPPRISLIMQTAFTQVSLGQPLAHALAHLIAHPQRPLLVVDGQQRLVGRLTSAGVLAGLHTSERSTFLSALQRSERPSTTALPGTQRPLDELLEPAPHVIEADRTTLDAAQLLLAQQIESLPVVDAEQRLLGIIARSGLVRALMQQSE